MVKHFVNINSNYLRSNDNNNPTSYHLFTPTSLETVQLKIPLRCFTDNWIRIYASDLSTQGWKVDMSFLFHHLGIRFQRARECDETEEHAFGAGIGRHSPPTLRLLSDSQVLKRLKDSNCCPETGSWEQKFFESGR